MSYFSNGIAYIEIPDADISEEMVNNVKRDFNSSRTSLRHTLPGATVQRTVFKARSPVSSVFNGYVWNSVEEIIEILDGTDYKPADV